MEPEPELEFNLEDLEITEDDPNFEEYKRIAERFRASNEEQVKEEDKGEAMYFDDENIPDEDDEAEDDEPKLSKKARKAKNKLTVAELKVSLFILHVQPELTDISRRW